MCLGCLSSFRYSSIFWDESWRPNQVLHQKRNGINTINQAVRKNSSRLRVDIRRRGGTEATVLEPEEKDCVPIVTALFAGSPANGFLGGWRFGFVRRRQKSAVPQLQ